MYVDSDAVDITDIVFTEAPKYIEGEDRFEVASGELAEACIYSHLSGAILLSAEHFDPVMAAAASRIAGAAE